MAVVLIFSSVWQPLQPSVLDGAKRWMLVEWHLTQLIPSSSKCTLWPAVSAIWNQRDLPSAWQLMQASSEMPACLVTLVGWLRANSTTSCMLSIGLCSWHEWQVTLRCSLVRHRSQAFSMVWQDRQKFGAFCEYLKTCT